MNTRQFFSGKTYRSGAKTPHVKPKFSVTPPGRKGSSCVSHSLFKPIGSGSEDPAGTVNVNGSRSSSTMRREVTTQPPVRVNCYQPNQILHDVSGFSTEGAIITPSAHFDTDDAGGDIFSPEESVDSGFSNENSGHCQSPTYLQDPDNHSFSPSIANNSSAVYTRSWQMSASQTDDENFSPLETGVTSPPSLAEYDAGRFPFTPITNTDPRHSSPSISQPSGDHFDVVGMLKQQQAMMHKLLTQEKMQAKQSEFDKKTYCH